MTLLEEARLAGRGVMALLMGRQNAPSYFDLSLHGLVGSFIAMLVVFSISAAYTIVSSPPEIDVHIWQLFLKFVFTYAAMTLAIAFMLSQFNRGDRLVPYLVASGWASVIGSILSAAGLTLEQTGAGLWSLVILVAILVVEVNIARSIVGLTLWRIVGFIAGQFVAILAIQMAIFVVVAALLDKS